MGLDLTCSGPILDSVPLRSLLLLAVVTCVFAAAHYCLGVLVAAYKVPECLHPRPAPAQQLLFRTDRPETSDPLSVPSSPEPAGTPRAVFSLLPPGTPLGFAARSDPNLPLSDWPDSPQDQSPALRATSCSPARPRQFLAFDRRSFYQNLNNSSQYLRRDSFVE